MNKENQDSKTGSVCAVEGMVLVGGGRVKEGD
jgi:hypothetical protein